MKYVRAMFGAAAAVWVVGCGTTTTNPPAEVKHYRIHLQATSGQLGAVSFAVSNYSGTPVVVAGAPVITQAVTVGSEWRVIAIGAISGIDLVQVDGGTNGQAPVVRVLDASTGAADNYRQLTTSQVQSAMASVVR